MAARFAKCANTASGCLAPENDQDRLIATLNGGTNPILLRTSDKNIRIAVVPDPTNVGREIVDP